MAYYSQDSLDSPTALKKTVSNKLRMCVVDVK